VSVALYVVVERAKKCLDFATTLYGWHIVICAVYNGLPGAWQWWTMIIGSCVVSILLGEYICARREMRDIIVRGA
jgi:hypothetical protein